MYSYKVTWRYYFFLIFFSLVLLLGVRVIYMLLNGEVSDENGPLPMAVAVMTSLVFLVVFSTYALTVCQLVRQLIKFDRCALTITPHGIENTLVFINVLAFVIVLPVKRIPWEAVTYYAADEGIPYIRVNTHMVQAGWAAKVLLKILGYHFCLSFVKPKVDAADLAPYVHRFSLKESLI